MKARLRKKQRRRKKMKQDFVYPRMKHQADTSGFALMREKEPEKYQELADQMGWITASKHHNEKTNS